MEALDRHEAGLYSLETPVSNVPTTAQLLETAIRINPFEQKFREANYRRQSFGEESKETSCADDGTIELSPSVARSSKAETRDLNTSKSLMSRKSSIANSAGLSLKLPPTLTSQSPGLFSNIPMLEDPGGSIDTPEITRLLNQYDGKGRAPRTAEVLNAVLDIATPRKLSAPNPRISQDPSEFSFGDSNRHHVSSPPPVIHGMGNEEAEGSAADDIPDTVATGSFPKVQPKEESINGSGPLMLSVRLGGPAGQLVQIPLELGFLGSGPSTESAASVVTSHVASGSVHHKNGSTSDRYTKVEALPVDKLQETGGVASSKMELSEELLEKTGLDGKRKDVMDRNKAAAVRYRKRKKEEFQNLQKKVLKLEEEKLELSTKVHVLQREIDRMAKRLDVHRTCSCNCEENEGVLDKQFGSDKHVIMVDPTKPMEAKPVVANSMNIKQFIGLASSAETRPLAASTTHASTLQQYVLQPVFATVPGSPRGSAVVMAAEPNPQFNLLPVVRLPAQGSNLPVSDNSDLNESSQM